MVWSLRIHAGSLVDCLPPRTNTIHHGARFLVLYPTVLQQSSTSSWLINCGGGFIFTGHLIFPRLLFIPHLAFAIDLTFCPLSITDHQRILSLDKIISQKEPKYRYASQVVWWSLCAKERHGNLVRNSFVVFSWNSPGVRMYHPSLYGFSKRPVRYWKTIYVIARIKNFRMFI
jgi:hypothetical protein